MAGMEIYSKEETEERLQRVVRARRQCGVYTEGFKVLSGRILELEYLLESLYEVNLDELRKQYSTWCK